MSAWRPIETEPLGAFLVYCPDKWAREEILAAVGLRGPDGTYHLQILVDGEDIRGATHWCALPAPPAPSDGDPK